MMIEWCSVSSCCFSGVRCQAVVSVVSDVSFRCHLEDVSTSRTLFQDNLLLGGLGPVLAHQHDLGATSRYNGDSDGHRQIDTTAVTPIVTTVTPIVTAVTPIVTT